MHAYATTCLFACTSCKYLSDGEDLSSSFYDFKKSVTLRPLFAAIILLSNFSAESIKQTNTLQRNTFYVMISLHTIQIALKVSSLDEKGINNLCLTKLFNFPF